MTDLESAIDWLIDFTWDLELEEDEVEDFTRAQFQNWQLFSKKSQETLVDIVRMATRPTEAVDVSGWLG